MIHSAETNTELTYATVGKFDLGDFSRTISRLRETARVNPDNTEVHEVLADAYVKRGEADLAEPEISAT